jgi:tetratricopeptide (TPR) repeat protein
MPTTVNGIGTHYYGKKNRTVRIGPCQSCGRVSNLVSYDTRLWFVIAFIPIIPLGRKRVIDSCLSCRRHYVADADAYEQASQLQVSAAQDQFRREPSRPAALQVHATLLGFHEREQAASFRRMVRERFPADAELMTGLAAQLERVSSYQEASELYEAAYRLQPELPEARGAMARRKMAEGALDEARRLLDFLEVHGAGQHYALDPLDVLSTYYQNQGRHEEALAIAAHLLREIPGAGQQHKFRGFVARSEKALGRLESILPPRQHSLRGLFRGDGHVYSKGTRWAVIGGVALLMIAGGLAINNEYIRRHRTIQVINPCGAPIQVHVDDQPPQTVTDTTGILVSEGKHRIQLSGPVEQTYDVDLAAGYFDRWFSKPAWVLVPGGEAALVEQTLYYAQNPPPAQNRLIVGRPFVAVRHVDYLFEQPPNSLEINRRDGRVVKISLQRFPGTDVRAFQAAEKEDRQGALAFIEQRIRRRPEDYHLLKAYHSSLEPGEYDRAESLLKSGLDRRPVAVQWHRLYQTLAELNGHDADLVARYDGSLKADPRNASLIYLRGRIDPAWEQEDQYFRRAIDADPRLPWPWAALGLRAAAAARWQESLRHLQKARELKIDEDVVKDAALAARLAMGEAVSLAKEYHTRLAANAMDFEPLIGLIEALAASGQPEEIEHELTAWQNRLPMEVSTNAIGPARVVGLYASGKLAECEGLCRSSPAMRDTPWRLHALLALKRTKEAADDAALQKLFEDPFHVLAVSLGLALEGKADEATAWRQRAAKSFESKGQEARRVAAILRATEPPTMDQVARVTFGSSRQALICALLAAMFPARRADYLAAAEKYNVRRGPPYQLVKLARGAWNPPGSSGTAKR